MRLPVVLAAAAVLLPSATGAVTGRIAWVTDGDTFRLEDGTRIRIADIDAPERGRTARCRGEVAQGHRATAIATGILADRVIDYEPVGHSYRRVVARVRLDGRDLGARLIAAGVARPWLRGQPKPDWCGLGPGRYR